MSFQKAVHTLIIRTPGHEKEIKPLLSLTIKGTRNGCTQNLIIQGTIRQEVNTDGNIFSRRVILKHELKIL